MDDPFWPTVGAIGTVVLGRVLDRWLNRGKEAREDKTATTTERAGVMTENEKLWARLDALQGQLDKCRADLSEMTAKYEGLEERNATMAQQLTAALLELGLYRRRYGPLPESNGGTHA